MLTFIQLSEMLRTGEKNEGSAMFPANGINSAPGQKQFSDTIIKLSNRHIVISSN
jgi:hypothetical protein